MPIPEPKTETDLWARVKARSVGWPDTDETAVGKLAELWQQGAAAFTIMQRNTPGMVVQSWPDPAGQDADAKLAAIADHAAQTETSMGQLGRYTAAFAEKVGELKRQIHDEVMRRDSVYRDYASLPSGAGDANLDIIVDAVAAFVDNKTQEAVDAVGSLGSGILLRDSPGPVGAELAGIEGFITDEMRRNSASPILAGIKGAFENPPFTDPEGAQAWALLAWANEVRPGGDWDHKPDILARTAGDNTYTPAPDLGGSVRYDLWSNIHYGYVGSEAAIPPGTLHAGANAADIPTQGGPDPGDQVAVQIGIELREKYGPDELRPEHVHEALRAHQAELTSTGMIRPD